MHERFVMVTLYVAKRLQELLASYGCHSGIGKRGNSRH